MAKAKIRHEGKTYVIELDGKYTKKEQELLERLGLIEVEKPKKKKYKNVKEEKPVEDNTEENGEA